MNEKYDVLIIGGGPAGLTAAIYSARAHLKTLVLAGSPPGGQLMWTTEVENFPGFVDGIMGPELIQNMRLQAQKYDAEFVDTNVKEVSGDFEHGFKVICEDSKTYSSRTVIVATGANAKWLELPSEQRLRGKGVSACAVCDGFFFRNKITAVVGGGDAAMEDANYLTKYADKVYVLVRGSKDSMRASKIMQDRAFSNPKIHFMFHTTVDEVLGEEKVTGVKIRNSLDDSLSELKIDGLFVAIGHKPSTDFLKGFVDLDEKGYVKVSNFTKSSVLGVFVGGDVSDYRYRQAITAAGFGCMAALDAEKFLAEHKL